MRSSQAQLNLCGSAICVAALLVLAIVPGAPVSAQGVITLDHAVRNCRLISDRDTRLSCYDSVIDEANASVSARPTAAPLASAPVQAPVKAAENTDLAVRAAPPQAQVAPSAPAVTSVPQTPVAAGAPVENSKRGWLSRAFGDGSQEDDGIKIASAARAPDGGVVITTIDGMTWRQADSEDVASLPKPSGR